MNLDPTVQSVAIGGFISVFTTVIGQLFVLFIQRLKNKAELKQKQLQIEHENHTRQETELVKFLNSELEFKSSTYSRYSFFLAKYCEKKNPLRDEYYEYQREFNNALMASDLPETIKALRDLHSLIISKQYLHNEEEYLKKLVNVQDCFIEEIKSHKQRLQNIPSPTHPPHTQIA